MAVIINDFEIVAEPPPQPRQEVPPQRPAAQPTQRDIEAAVLRQFERLLRVAAT